ncbi:cupin domain-containing protein [Paenibacillus pinistramenti]|uniref:cupin domain-containing protein n=1 Tax=Paenibacillus pinistramenti TaxID=1768003 RepID=UPI001109F0BC|nr:cupin domain-containing protein [Paenibacillus pinistramenti]
MDKKTFVSAADIPNGKFAKHILFQNGEQTVFVLQFAAGQKLPDHKHPGAILYATLLEGAGKVTVDGQDVEMKRGDVIQVTEEEEFSFTSAEGVESNLYVTLIKL